LLTEKRFKDETKESIHIISDLRKRSEFEFIKENFKNTEIKAVRLLNNKNNHDNHISEIDLDKANIFDIAINTSILNASATLLLMLDAMKTWGW
jgi:cytidylate kinase